MALAWHTCADSCRLAVRRLLILISLFALIVWPMYGAWYAVTSIRLENYRDGVEDYEMLAMLREQNETAVTGFISEVVTDFQELRGINVTADVSQFEKTRREVAMALSPSRLS